jgi:hypothetical protein
MAIERAVNAGNGWHSVGLTPKEIKEGVEYINELLSGKGKEASDFVISLRKNLQIKGISEKKTDRREILRGIPGEISEGIERYKESGVSHLVFQVLSGTLEGIVETMELFSRKIRPAISP